MAERQRTLSVRDEIYLQSTSLEVYMGAGAAFLLVFTAIFIFSIKAHGLEWLVWPGFPAGAVAGYITMKWLERRELVRQRAEVEADPRTDETYT